MGFCWGGERWNEFLRIPAGVVSNCRWRNRGMILYLLVAETREREGCVAWLVLRRRPCCCSSELNMENRGDCIGQLCCIVPSFF